MLTKLSKFPILPLRVQACQHVRMSATAPPATGQPLLTVLDLAARLKVSRTTAQQLMYSGAIASLKIQRSRRVSEEALAEYLARVSSGTPTIKKKAG